METTAPKRPSASIQENSTNSQPQEQTAGQRPDWLNQLAGLLPNGKEDQQKWYKLLAHPLAIVAALVAFGYWWFKQKQPPPSHLEQENGELKKKLKKIKKKYKKMKKHLQAGDNLKGAAPATLR